MQAPSIGASTTGTATNVRAWAGHRQAFPLGQSHTPLTSLPTLGRALTDGNLHEVGFVNSFLEHLAHQASTLEDPDDSSDEGTKYETHEGDVGEDDRELTREYEHDDDDYYSRHKKRRSNRWRANYPRIKKPKRPCASDTTPSSSRRRASVCAVAPSSPGRPHGSAAPGNPDRQGEMRSRSVSSYFALRRNEQSGGCGFIPFSSSVSASNGSPLASSSSPPPPPSLLLLPPQRWRLPHELGEEEAATSSSPDRLEGGGSFTLVDAQERPSFSSLTTALAAASSPAASAASRLLEPPHLQQHHRTPHHHHHHHHHQNLPEWWAMAGSTPASSSSSPGVTGVDLPAVPSPPPHGPISLPAIQASYYYYYDSSSSSSSSSSSCELSSSSHHDVGGGRGEPLLFHHLPGGGSGGGGAGGWQYGQAQLDGLVEASARLPAAAARPVLSSSSPPSGGSFARTTVRRRAEEEEAAAQEEEADSWQPSTAVWPSLAAAPAHAAMQELLLAQAAGGRAEAAPMTSSPPASVSYSFWPASAAQPLPGGDDDEDDDDDADDGGDDDASAFMGARLISNAVLPPVEDESCSWLEDLLRLEPSSSLEDSSPLATTLSADTPALASALPASTGGLPQGHYHYQPHFKQQQQQEGWQPPGVGVPPGEATPYAELCGF